MEKQVEKGKKNDSGNPGIFIKLSIGNDGNDGNDVLYPVYN